MVRCINLQSPEVAELAKILKNSKVITATKLAVWQKAVEDTSAIPTAAQLDYIKSPSKANVVLGTSYKPEISNTQLKTLVKIVDSLNLKMNKQGVKKRYRVETRIGTNPNAYAWVLLEFDNSIKLDRRIEKAEEQGRYGEAQRLEFMRESDPQFGLFTDDITTEVKAGVSELFESNPELANVVYESLGFRVPNITVLPNGNLKIVAFRTEKVGPTSKGEYQRGKGLYLSLDKPYPGEDVYTIELEISPKNLLDRKLGFGEISEDYFIDEKNKRVDRQLDTLHEFKQSLGIKAEIGSIDGALMNELVLFDKNLIDKALASKQVYNPQQKQQALQLYSQYLESLNKPNTNPVLQGNQANIEEIITQLEKEGLLEIDCKGKLKAEKGLATSFVKGGKWKVIKDLKGYPTHKEGGVDLTIGKGGVSIKNGNTQFTAKYGLVIPKN